jgi:hypothetical protein
MDTQTPVVEMVVICQTCNQPLTDNHAIIKAPCGETAHKHCETNHVAKCKKAECSMRALGF